MLLYSYGLCFLDVLTYSILNRRLTPGGILLCDLIWKMLLLYRGGIGCVYRQICILFSYIVISAGD